MCAERHKSPCKIRVGCEEIGLTLKKLHSFPRFFLYRVLKRYLSSALSEVSSHPNVSMGLMHGRYSTGYGLLRLMSTFLLNRRFQLILTFC